MKIKLVSIFLCISLAAGAQAYEERSQIRKTYDGQKLLQLKQSNEKTYAEQQLKIKNYLLLNPGKKKQFQKNGKLYFLHHIDADGNAIYITTKDLQQIQHTKSNQLYQGGSLGVNITGTNMVAGVWDGGQINPNHELLTGKVQMQSGQTLTSSAGDSHMNAVTGILAGRDLSSGNYSTLAAGAKGIAFDATTKNYDWDNDVSEMADFAAQGYLISNHSYGYINTTDVPVWVFGAYDSTSKDWDVLTKQTPYYLPFIAVGNEQTDPESGNLADGGYDMITGSSASKNVMTVGSIESDNSMNDYSNWGPTDDGRVKPDIVTLGSTVNTANVDTSVSPVSNNSYTGNVPESSGTSYASPAAAAVGLLLQQYYHSLFGSYMKASSLKALMLHTADDAGNAGPDAKFGWGILNAEKAAQTIQQMQTGGTAKLVEYMANPANNSSDALTITGVSGQQPVRVSICWTDDEGPEQTSADGIDNTTSRLVYRFGGSLKIQATGSAAVEKFTFKPLSVTNPQAIAVEGTGIWDNPVDNYQQINGSGIDNAGITVSIYKHTSSPATVKPFSVLITGLKSNTASLGTAAERTKEKIVFHDSVNGYLRMISNRAADGFGSYTIYDMSGRIIQSGKEASNEISVKNLQKGVYILHYANAKQAFKFKL
ncbi:serine protease AprX [Chryseobacterium sp. SORGH_AS 447]|uniref:S8 family serine peptidase n=1 Tax=Chryseobacterium sp. SORGH_AS_0447 TaxID=3041769 RepID=UPI002784B9C2|nr:S8 family serine peptidase [Chryseobacterium sp. SORGH_AS_0447]MDQ1162200.1 serine protease AprX [Chryseobacterium sp. SORGH_AS_0447]